MIKKVEMSILNDYYGGLLTEYQRDVIVRYYDEDLSLAEIAEETGVSRQAVRDVIVRSTAKLVEFEKSLGLVAKISAIGEQIEDVIASTDAETAEKLKNILGKIKEL